MSEARRPIAEQPVNPVDADPAYLKRQLMALVGVLRRKGVITYPEFLAEVHQLEAHDDFAPGARVVARAWTDPAFKQRLLENGIAACAELGIEIGPPVQELQVVENTDRVHHVAVCTTCSCYPTPLLGMSPDWYKGQTYRTRVVQEPRDVLREFGLELGEETDVRVINTTATRRCLVLPRRPAGTEALSAAELAALVTRDSMIGVGLAGVPR